MSDLMDYIKVQWADIHHSRNQEWKILLIIAGVFYALFKIKLEYREFHTIIALLGLGICSIGIYVAISHWILFQNKVKLIDACEKELGIYAKFHKPGLPVQGIILVIYFILFGILLSWLFWIYKENVFISILFFLISIGIGIVSSIYANKKISIMFRNKELLTINY